MIIGHLPAGYLIARLAQRVSTHLRDGHWSLMAAAMAGSVFPDIDMFWFHLIDQRSVNHHEYWTHIPAFWVGLLALAAPAWMLLRRQVLPAAVFLFFIGVMSHMVLDTVTGYIRWLSPFNPIAISLNTVRALYSPWYLNFLLHWTFGIELVLTAAAAILAWRRWRINMPFHSGA
jgi:inner membrane protein